MRRRSLATIAAALALIAPLAPTAVAAQGVDRTKAPVPAKAPALTIPTIRNAVLPNGAQLRVVEQRELPLVTITLTLRGGARFDGELAGLASFTANMLDEGAGARTAEQLQAEIAFLGASLSTSAGWDRMTVSLAVPRRSLDAALDLMADVVLRPTFAAAEVARQRDLRLAGLLQQRDQPQALATAAFSHTFFPAGHPYRRALGGDSVSTARLDSATVRAFYDRMVRADLATFFVAGDLSTAEARAAIERRFGGWARSPRPLVAPGTPAVNAPAATQVVLVDKPGAAQSVILVGAPGADRRAPEYAALEIMNTILGGSFSSRLNTVLRETKGYTYGANSRFDWRVVPGPFLVSTAVRTNVTDSALVEIMRELKAIRDVPVGAEELARAKAYEILALPSALETNGGITAMMATLAEFGYPLGQLAAFTAAADTLTAADLQRAARQAIPVDRLTIVVVGDLAKVRAGIEALGLGPSTVRTVGEILR